MSKPEFSRPFSLEHARAGAPYCCRDGQQAEILKWDCNHQRFPLIGVVCEKTYHYPESWTVSGEQASDEEFERRPGRDLVMLPIGMLQSKPVFMGDELVTRFGEKFVVEKEHIGDLDEENTWPPSYPVTQMLLEDFDSTIIASGSKECISASAACAIANAAIRHAIDAGQVVLADVSEESVRQAYADGQAIAYKHEAGGRAARDLAVAVAVNNAVAEIALTRNFVFGLDLPSIIASVTGSKDAKEGAK